jgi:hypothetical protein
MPGSVHRLYHLADAANLPSILKHGLMSTEKLLALAGVPAEGRRVFTRGFRAANVPITADIVVRDQRPMPPRALARALDGGLEPEDWYEFLNGFVFFWTDPARLERQRRACGDRPQVALVFDGKSLFDTFGHEAFFSPINSGNARRKPAQRSRETIMPFHRWSETGWPSGQRWRMPAEVLFTATIPVRPPFLLSDTVDVA